MRQHGCIVCRKLGLIRYPEIHHILSGGRRIGHDDTIPLCPWHHQGVPADMVMGKKNTERWLGPSMKESKIRFNRRFGTEAELLMEINKWLEGSAEKQGVPKAQGQNESSLPF
jgi:hypothetical protein